MKTFHAFLIVAAASAALTLNAEPLTSPKASGHDRPVAASGVQDPNLIPANLVGKRTADVVLVSATSTDGNSLAATKCEGMAPKAKDSAACAKHCEKFANK